MWAVIPPSNCLDRLGTKQRSGWKQWHLLSFPHSWTSASDLSSHPDSLLCGLKQVTFLFPGLSFDLLAATLWNSSLGKGRDCQIWAAGCGGGLRSAESRKGKGAEEGEGVRTSMRSSKEREEGRAKETVPA